MNYLVLAIAIINLTSIVLRTVLNNHQPAYHAGHCVNNNILYRRDSVTGVFTNCNQLPSIGLNNDWIQTNKHCGALHYTRDQLVTVNKSANRIPDTLCTLLSQLGIKNQKCVCNCNNNRKFQRGTRGGKKRFIKRASLALPFHSATISHTHSETTSENLETEELPIDQSLYFRLLLFNTQSAGNKTDLLNDLVFQSNADVAFFTETWIRPIGDEVIISSLTPPGYKLVSFPRHNRRGGGICLIHRLSLNIVTKAVHDFSTFECCECCLHYKGHNIAFICIYHPPPSKINRHTNSEFISDFQDCLDKYIQKKTWPVIIGDFNIHFDDPSDSDTKKMKQILNTYGLYQLVNQPTHKKGHTLDWVLTDSVKMMRNMQVIDKCLSDHYVISFDLNIRKPGKQKRVLSTRSTDIDHVRFSSDIKELLPNIKDCTSDKVQAYNNNMADLLNKHAPLKTRTVTDRPSAPWMTSGIKQAKAERRRAERKWRSTNGTVFKEIYRHSLNKVKALIKHAKYHYYNARITECMTSKALFNITGHMSGKKCQTCLPTSVLKPDLPNIFATFFKDKVTKIREKLDTSFNITPQFEPFCGAEFSEFRSVSQAEVKSIIKSSPPKSCCLDPIPTPLLVRHIDSVIEIITTIINESLQQGIVPSLFKQAVVVPLLKKPNLSPEELKNFRPVSNLPFLSKILEKVVLQQLKDHLTNNNLTETYQSAYRECHNTETALLRVHNDLLCEADEGKVSILALLDLSAAFDTIDHNILIERLSKTFGISGLVLNWFRSYLLGRSQSVIVQSFRSEIVSLDFGVPQGSVLGPMLYTLYTQPLGALIRKHNVNYHMYADDTQLYKSLLPQDQMALLTTMEQCIDDVKNWMIVNKLKMNEDKTEVIFCDPKRKCESTANYICIENERVNFEEKAKNLGVIFDSMLSMKHHFNHVSQILFCELRRIGHMSCFLDETSLKTLMSAFILTRLDYCNSLFVNLPEESLNKLQRFQNRAARIVLKKKKRDHIRPLLKKLHWLPLKARILYKTAILCFKCIHNKAPSYLQDLVEVYTPSRSLRSGSHCLLRIPRRGSCRLAGRSFTHAAPAVWNALPLSLRLATSETAFKTGLKTYLFTTYVTDSHCQ